MNIQTTMNSNNNNNNSFRTWKRDTASTSSGDTQAPQSSNAFSQMSRDKQDRYRSAGPSYSDFKRMKDTEAKEKERTRPLTEADFPALFMGSVPVTVSVPVSVKVKTQGTTSSLATHIADTIRKDEETLTRRKHEDQEAREKAEAEEGFVRLPLFKNVKDYIEWKKNGGLQLPPIEVPRLRRRYKTSTLHNEDDEYDEEDTW